MNPGPSSFLPARLRARQPCVIFRSLPSPLSFTQDEKEIPLQARLSYGRTPTLPRRPLSRHRPPSPPSSFLLSWISSLILTLFEDGSASRSVVAFSLPADPEGGKETAAVEREERGGKNEAHHSSPSFVPSPFFPPSLSPLAAFALLYSPTRFLFAPLRLALSPDETLRLIFSYLANPDALSKTCRRLNEVSKDPYTRSQESTRITEKCWKRRSEGKEGEGDRLRESRGRGRLEGTTRRAES